MEFQSAPDIILVIWAGLKMSDPKFEVTATFEEDSAKGRQSAGLLEIEAKIRGRQISYQKFLLFLKPNFIFYFQKSSQNWILKGQIDLKFGP